MTQPRIRLITRGDDCGSNHTANRAIREAFRNGILKNTWVMAPCAAVREAAALLAGETGLCCGLHATVTAEWDRVRWGPVLPPNQVPSLVDGNGHFYPTTQELHKHGPRLSEIMAELEAQLDLLRQLGFDIRYADQHMRFGWVTDGLEEAFDRWCERKGIRNSRHYVQRLPTPPAHNLDPVETLIAQLDAASPGQYLIVGHPAYDNEEMRGLGHAGNTGDQVAVRREWQRRMFTDHRIIETCTHRGVLPIRYDEAQWLQ